MYKLTDDPSVVMRLEDNMTIPEGHRFWDEYQAWLDEGNSPEPVGEAIEPKKLIADYRWAHMLKGTLFNGTLLATDDVAQTRVNGAAISAMLDENYTLDWKGTDGEWVTLNAQQVLAVAIAIRNYVQGCYNREKELADMVDAGTYTSDMLTTGWPT